MSAEAPNTGEKNTPLFVVLSQKGTGLCLANTKSRVAFLRIYSKGYSESLREEP